MQAQAGGGSGSPVAPAKKSVTDLVAEAFDAAWAPDQRRQLLAADEGSDRIHAVGDRSQAYAAHTVIVSKVVASQSSPTHASGASSPASRQPARSPQAGRDGSGKDSGDGAGDDESKQGTRPTERHRDDGDGDDDGDDDGDNNNVAGGNSSRNAAAKAPLLQPEKDDEELDRVSRLIADRIKISLSVATSAADTDRGSKTGGGGNNNVGPRARGLLQKTSPKRHSDGGAGMMGAAPKSKAGSKIAARFSSNPLAAAAGPGSQQQQQQQQQQPLRPLRGMIQQHTSTSQQQQQQQQQQPQQRQKRRKKLWEAKLPAAGLNEAVGDDVDGGAVGDDGDGGLPPLPFATTSSVIARGPGRRSRQEMVQSVRDTEARCVPAAVEAAKSQVKKNERTNERTNERMRDRGSGRRHRRRCC